MTRWQNSDLEIKCAVVPRYFWTTASIDVFLNGACILRTGGVFKSSGAQKNAFTQNGREHEVELSWQSPEMIIYFPYKLLIDGELIASSRIAPGNWPILCIPVVILAILSLFPMMRHLIY
jgi:hypothetical protein